jgi:hypothetical protein
MMWVFRGLCILLVLLRAWILYRDWRDFRCDRKGIVEIGMCRITNVRKTASSHRLKLDQVW